ncbi:MAG: hypothetical protein HYX51_11250 [Chloroflexi bacterium]|nr:hypothetical protein [Chloroflexota bacterium]
MVRRSAGGRHGCAGDIAGEGASGGRHAHDRAVERVRTVLGNDAFAAAWAAGQAMQPEEAIDYALSAADSA